jgi:hypothetical protein
VFKDLLVLALCVLLFLILYLFVRNIHWSSFFQGPSVTTTTDDSGTLPLRLLELHQIIPSPRWAVTG